MHDPRVGRFFAIDPLSAQYPHNSPYAFSENRVLDRNELEGLETGPTFTETLTFAKNSKLSLIEAGDIIDKNRKINNYGVLAIGLVLTDVYITKGWLSRSMVASSYGDFFHSMQMQSYYRVQGNEKKAKSYQKEGAEATKDLILNGLASKVVSTLGIVQKIAKRKELAKLWGIETKYIDYNEKVLTETLDDGVELVQYRLKGYEGTKGNYYAKAGTKPEEIGLKTEDIAETYKVIVKGNGNKVLNSTHIKDKAPYYEPDGKTIEGGGKQIFSRDLKNNATFEKIDNP